MSTRPILDVADELGVAREHVIVCGRDKAKIDPSALADGRAAGAGRLILVSAINPTPAGEGKTTTSIGLAHGHAPPRQARVLCLREPSLGPVFGVKGGGTGGGRATLVPADDINLHFTGDIHAITSAHNLLSAMIDNALHFGGTTSGTRRARSTRGGHVGPRARHERPRAAQRRRGPRRQRRTASRARALRHHRGERGHGHPRAREGPRRSRGAPRRIVVGTSTTGARSRRADLGASSAMTALLRDALKPNLVQTAEGGPRSFTRALRQHRARLQLGPRDAPRLASATT
jgi:formate--tetrahydrofolate ligase